VFRGMADRCLTYKPKVECLAEHRVIGLGGLHCWSGSAMKLYSARLASQLFEAEGSGPQQTEGEPSDEQRVYSSRQN
jgi:hypothetical protein